MLEKTNRLQKERDFRSVFKLSKPVYSGRLAIRAANLKFNSSRFGFVISNKIEKRATRRNSIKRKLRAAAREILPKMQGKFSIVVIVVQPYEFPFDFALIKRDLESGLLKAKVINA
ncbi:MAG TPA: ribonuclease P protein component [bacterium]|nr:ribonuclease P protein component [bacterium]